MRAWRAEKSELRLLPRRASLEVRMDSGKPVENEPLLNDYDMSRRKVMRGVTMQRRNAMRGGDDAAS